MDRLAASMRLALRAIGNADVRFGHPALAVGFRPSAGPGMTTGWYLGETRCSTPIYAIPKNARVAEVAFAAVTSISSPRSRATASQICARYIGSLRLFEGCGRMSRGNR